MNIRAPFNCTEIGKWLAHADDAQQAEVMNALASELRVSCGDKMDTQLCFLAGHLTDKGGAMVTELAEFHKLRNEG